MTEIVEWMSFKEISFPCWLFLKLLNYDVTEIALLTINSFGSTSIFMKMLHELSLSNDY